MADGTMPPLESIVAKRQELGKQKSSVICIGLNNNGIAVCVKKK